MPCVYLIHLHKKLGHAKHYIGYTKDETPSRRLEKHLKGKGSKMLAHCIKVGIKFRLVRQWSNQDQAFERRLKKQKKARMLCPVCNPKTANTREAHQLACILISS